MVQLTRIQWLSLLAFTATISFAVQWFEGPYVWGDMIAVTVGYGGGLLLGGFIIALIWRVFSKQVPLFRILFCTVLAVSAVQLLKVATEPKTAKNDAMLVRLNQELPKQIDEFTRLDRISFEGKTFAYHTTLIGEVVGRTTLQEDLSRLAKSNVCSNPELSGAFADGLNFRFIYYGVEKELLADVAISGCE